MDVGSNKNFSVADGIARIFLIALAAVFPFFIVPLPYFSVAQSKMLVLAALFLLTLLAWAYARLSEGAIHIPRLSLLYVSALLPIAYLASTAMTGWTSVSLVGFGTEQDTLAAVSLMTALFLLTTFLFWGNMTAIRLFVQTATISLTILFALQALYVFFPSWFSLGVLEGQTANLFGSWHDLGIFAGLSFFIALTLWFSDYFTGWKKGIVLLFALTSFFTLLLVHFADILWGTGALFLVAAIAVARAARVAGMPLMDCVKRSALFLVVGIALVGAGFFGAATWEKLPDPIGIAQTEVRPSWQGTFDVARNTLQAPAEFVFGTGPNSFIREWGLHKPAGVNQTPFWNSDFNSGVGIIPTSIFTSGLIGLIAWAALILALLGLAYRFFRESRPLSSSRATLGVAILGVAYLVVYHMIYTPSVTLTVLTFVGLGLLAAIAAGDASARVFRLGLSSVGNMVRLLVFVVLVLAAIASAGFIGREVLSNVFINRAAYVYQTTNDAAAAGESLKTAFLISPNNDRAHRAAAELGVVRLAQMMQEADPNNAQAQRALQTVLQETIQHGLSAVSIDSSNYQNWLLLAQVYSNFAGVNIAGAFEEARNAYQKAFEANPTNPLSKFRLAQLHLLNTDRASAKTALQEALALKPDFAAAHFLLSQIEAADGNGDAAVQAAAAAVQLVPQDPLGWFNLGYILYTGQSYRDAALALQQAVTLANDYSNALFYLALAYDAMDMPNDAVVALERVQALNPSETYIAQMIANIKAGKAPGEGVQIPTASQ